MAESVWRDESEQEYEGVYCECFFTFSQLVEYIQEYYDRKVKDDEDEEWRIEPPDQRYWWDCTWFMLRNGKCEKIQCFALSAKGILISFGDPRMFLPRDDLFAEYHYFINPHNVIVPFEPGDILEYDARPFGKPLFVVWGKNGSIPFPDEQDTHRGRCERLQYLYQSEDREGLDISSRGDTD